MTAMDRIRRDFERERKEPGYSANEFSAASTYFGRTPHPDTIKAYASEHGLSVDLKRDTNLNLKGSPIQALIPESNLEALMEGMKVYANIEEFIEKLKFSRKNTGVNRKNRNSRSSRYGM